MMHQHEIHGAGTEPTNDTANPGVGNREAASPAQAHSNFYNRWDGGGAGGAHATAMHAGRGPKGYTRSDERIMDDVHRVLTDDALLDATDIEVEVMDGEVTLSGSVSSRDDKRRAEVLLDSISGIHDVQNRLRISQTL